MTSLNVNLSRFENRLDLFNEWTTGMITISTCLFTDIYDVQQHMEFGWYVCAFTCLGLAINIGFMLTQQAIIFKYQCISRCKRNQHEESIYQ